MRRLSSFLEGSVKGGERGERKREREKLEERREGDSRYINRDPTSPLFFSVCNPLLPALRRGEVKVVPRPHRQQEEGGGLGGGGGGGGNSGGDRGGGSGGGLGKDMGWTHERRYVLLYSTYVVVPEGQY